MKYKNLAILPTPDDDDDDDDDDDADDDDRWKCGPGLPCVMGTKCTHKDNNTSEFRSCGDFFKQLFFILII